MEREREREKFCVINVKYKEISWRVRKKKKRRRRRRRKKVTSRSTEELVLKKDQNILTFKGKIIHQMLTEFVNCCL